MKRFTAVLMSVICLLGLTGCGNSASEPSDTQVFETIETGAGEQNTTDTADEDTKEQNTLDAIDEDSKEQSNLGAAGEGSGEQPAADENTNSENETKAAVVYFSGTGNTKAVAEVIAAETGADIYEIVPAEEYTADDLNYNDDNCRANAEMNDESARPAIQNDLSAVSDYDTIYLGYPIWWGTCPRIIQTFLENYDVSAAQIYTFCTSGGSGISKSISDLQTIYPNLNIVDGKRLNGATEADIKEWTESNTKNR